MIPISAASSITPSEIGGAAAREAAPAIAPSTSNKSAGFADLVQDFVRQTNADHQNADAAIQQLVTGQTDSIQNVVMAITQADLSFQLFMELRNKIIESFNEVMRMQF